MQELGNYRLVLIEIRCPDKVDLIGYETHTTRTDEELLRTARAVGSEMCRSRGEGHWRAHRVTVTTIPEQSTGARRA